MNLILLYTLCLTFYTIVYASFEYGGMKDIGARPLSMGGAYVAISDEVDAGYWNPSGLAQNDIFKEITFMHTNLFGLDELPYSFLSFAVPESKFGAFGLSTVSLGNSGYYSENTVILSYGKKVYSSSLLKVNLGTNLKYLSLTYSTISKQGYGIDFGFLANFLFLQESTINLGTIYRIDKLKNTVSNTRVGVSYQFRKKIIIAFDYDLDTKSIHFGGEVSVIKYLLDLRAGNIMLKSNKYLNNIITSGFGFTIKAWRLDFAYMFSSESLPNSCRISVTTKF